MRKIILFMNVSLDGYFEGPRHDLSWANNDFEAFSSEQGQEVDTLLFGHRTYDDFRSFWPTPQARAIAPEVADFLNERHKVVVSHEPFEPGWSNVTVISENVAEEIMELKEQPGKTILIFGSNNLCVSLVEEGLIDELQILVNPVVLGGGTSLFAGLSEKVPLTLAGTRRFDSGVMMLTYHPGRR